MIEVGDIAIYSRADGVRTRWEVIAVRNGWVTLRRFQPRARVKSGARFRRPVRSFLADRRVVVQGSLW